MMARNYSPNHPAVRASLNLDTPPRQPTVRERRQAVNARLGRSGKPPRSRAVMGVISIFATFPAMGWGEAHGELWVQFVPLAFAIYCLAPWMRDDWEDLNR
jgi:hypothetical protein